MSLSSDYHEYDESAGFLTREEIQRCVMSQSDLEKEHKGQMLKARHNPSLASMHRRLYRLGLVMTSNPYQVLSAKELEMSP